MSDNDLDTCLSKRQYRNKRTAEKASGKLARKSGVNFAPYQCPVCFGWHLVSGGFIGQPSIRKPLRDEIYNIRATRCHAKRRSRRQPNE